MLGAFRKRVEADVTDALLEQPRNNRLNEMLTDSKAPQIRAHGQWTEEPDGSPPYAEARPGEPAIDIRGKRAMRVFLPARPRVFPIKRVGREIGNLAPRAKCVPNDRFGLGQLIRSKRAHRDLPRCAYGPCAGGLRNRRLRHLIGHPVRSTPSQRIRT